MRIGVVAIAIDGLVLLSALGGSLGWLLGHIAATIIVQERTLGARFYATAAEEAGAGASGLAVCAVPTDG
jgi:hypothetical protein